MAIAPTQNSFRAIIVGKSAMMKYHDPARIESYCRSCDKYGAYWSCPPFEESPFLSLPEWTDAVLITQKVPVAPDSNKSQLIEQFQAARESLGESLLSAESQGALAVIAGHCFGCSTCPRTRGKPCGIPSRMRHSLEALGFDVTGLAEGPGGQTIEWPQSGLPSHLTLVGAILCHSSELAKNQELRLNEVMRAKDRTAVSI